MPFPYRFPLFGAGSKRDFRDASKSGACERIRVAKARLFDPRKAGRASAGGTTRVAAVADSGRSVSEDGAGEVFDLVDVHDADTAGRGGQVFAQITRYDDAPESQSGGFADALFAARSGAYFAR